MGPCAYPNSEGCNPARELTSYLRIEERELEAPHTCATSIVSAAVSNNRASRIAELLPEAAETHHTVFRITDGEDPDSASWYASWLLDLSELPDLLDVPPVRSHLVHALVGLDRDYMAAQPSERWEDWSAARLSTTGPEHRTCRSAPD
jgi:hypothetical protein